MLRQELGARMVKLLLTANAIFEAVIVAVALGDLGIPLPLQGR